MNAHDHFLLYRSLDTPSDALAAGTMADGTYALLVRRDRAQFSAWGAGYRLGPPLRCHLDAIPYEEVHLLIDGGTRVLRFDADAYRHACPSTMEPRDTVCVPMRDALPADP